MSLVYSAIVESTVVATKQQCATHHCHRLHRQVVDARLLHLIFCVVEHQIAKRRGKVGSLLRERHIVDCLVRREDCILDVGDVDHFAIAVNHINVAVVIHHHKIFLVAVVVYLLDEHIAQVVTLVECLVLLRFLVVAEEVVAHQIIHFVASVDNVLHILARKCGMDFPVAHTILCLHRGGSARQQHQQQQK